MEKAQSENKVDPDTATNPEDEVPLAAWGDWEEWKNDNGISYYYNKKTEESVWEDPRSEEEKKAMEKQEAELATQDFLPREALKAALQQRALGKEAEKEAAAKNVGPTLPEVSVINTIREGEEETVRSLDTSRTSFRKRGISEFTEYSDSEDGTLRARGSSAAELSKRNRALLRIDSATDWQGNELKKLHDEMQEQLEKMTANARQSGIAVPKLHKRAPRTAPPAPPPKKAPSPVPPRPTSLPPKPTSTLPPKPNSALPPGPPVDQPEDSDARAPSPLPSPAPSPSASVRSTQSLPGPSLKRQSSVQLNNAPFTVVAAWVPEATSRTKIEIQPGDEVLVVKQGSSGWWLGKNLRTNKSGYFPGSFCKPGLSDNSTTQSAPMSSPLQRTISEPTSTSSHLKPTRPPPRPSRPPKRVSGMWRGKLMAERSKLKKKREEKRMRAASAASASSAAGVPTYSQSQRDDYEW